MQLQDYLSNESTAKPELFNCASCQGKSRKKCLHEVYGKKEVEILSYLKDDKGNRIKLRITGFDDICEYIDKLRIDRPNVSEIECVLFGSGHEICPIALIDELSYELLNMIYLCDKIKPTEYFDQPALLMQGMKVVNSERARLAKLRMATDGKK